MPDVRTSGFDDEVQRMMLRSTIEDYSSKAFEIDNTTRSAIRALESLRLFIDIRVLLQARPNDVELAAGRVCLAQDPTLFSGVSGKSQLEEGQIFVLMIMGLGSTRAIFNRNNLDNRTN